MQIKSSENESGLTQSKYCFGCAKTLHVSAATCPSCGARQAGALVGQKSRMTAAILALFLGGFGVHKFYLGKTAAGIIYLLFCVTFIPSMISFVEFIIYLTMSDEAFAAKYAL